MVEALNRADALDRARKETFIDRVGYGTPRDELWPAWLIPAELIDLEIARLAAVAAPENGRRRALVVHPRSEAPGLGLAPGIRVSIDVLLPGESTLPIRHNSSEVNFCIRGGGQAVIDDTTIRYQQYDVWNHPSMATYVHVNDTDNLQVRLTYSNAALLEKLNVHFVDEHPEPPGSMSETPADKRRDEDVDTLEALFEDYIELGHDGAFLMSYEKLIDPDVVEQRALHWPWQRVQEYLDQLEALGDRYKGRRLYLLYNRATGRTNGTTNSFFATMCIRPPHIVDVPHRHTAAAINYFFRGTGYSTVGGRRIEWKAGDLMLSAPGWAVHNHASNDEPVYELTIQDSPFHLAIDSLLWQENLRREPILLGSHGGWSTNRTELT
jgi:gentisate 1,2-dioxygenase